VKRRYVMPRKARNVPCTFTTKSGRPCKAHAVKGTDPPACAAHAGRTADAAGAPPNNQNARTHGFYSSVLNPEELADLILYADDLSLDDEIACARVSLRRLLALLDASTLATYEEPENQRALTPTDYARLTGLALQATRTIARLLRDQRALTGEAADGIAGAIAQALDELSTEWGIEL
jgi:hypothetical protein